MVRHAYQGIGTEYETLLGAFDKDNERFKKRIGIYRAASSYKVRVRSRNHLAVFIKKCYKRSDISMLELTPDENPSIGIILCAEKDHLEVELALQDVNKPIGVAEYQYLLPKNKLQELVTNEIKSSGNRDS